jgi:acetyl esterase/lipase
MAITETMKAADTSGKASLRGEEIPLWAPFSPPGSEGLDLQEQVIDHGPLGDPRRTLSGIAAPSLSAYFPQQPNGAAAVLIGGGGYTSLVIDTEGTDVARWLNTLGVTAFVLKHRLPGEGHAEGQLVPLQDGQRALRLVRQRAAEWGLDAARIGVVGLSSGAHLASMMGTSFAERVYAPRDAIDAADARPSFMVLGYGPYSANARQSLINPQQAPMLPVEKQALYDRFPTDQQIHADTPPCFLMHTDNDARVNPLNSIRFYLALKAAGLPAELHIFQDGGHGVAIRRTEGYPVASWPRLCANWLQQQGFLPAA